jgi:ATP-binding protein involved in chromosome partitioning
MNRIIPVISGKGGVGKSTVAVNLAVSLARSGYKIALIDADCYGPSIPTLMNGGELKVDHEGKVIPPLKYGIKYISIGFYLPDPDAAVIWRGPMLTKTLSQMFSDVAWGEIDFFVVDMPPGTGDVAITLSQMMQGGGAVIVTTPQEVALADVRKSVNMLHKVNIKILGVIENMSGYVDVNGSVVEIFGKGGGEKLAKEIGVSLYASLPLDISIRESCDNGVPIATDESSHIAKTFQEFSEKLIQEFARVQSEAGSPKILN